jgi:hypothetical protein
MREVYEVKEVKEAKEDEEIKDRLQRSVKLRRAGGGPSTTHVSIHVTICQAGNKAEA